MNNLAHMLLCIFITISWGQIPTSDSTASYAILLAITKFLSIGSVSFYIAVSTQSLIDLFLFNTAKIGLFLINNNSD